MFAGFVCLRRDPVPAQDTVPASITLSRSRACRHMRQATHLLAIVHEDWTAECEHRAKQLHRPCASRARPDGKGRTPRPPPEREAMFPLCGRVGGILPRSEPATCEIARALRRRLRIPPRIPPFSERERGAPHAALPCARSAGRLPRPPAADSQRHENDGGLRCAPPTLRSAGDSVSRPYTSPQPTYRDGHL